MADRTASIVRAAWLYYEDGLTQAEIADQLSVSRATVGRLLDDARQSGLVTFQFHSDGLQALSLSQEVRDTFQLDSAVVIPDVPGSDGKTHHINERVARGAAQYLVTHQNSPALMAIGWGDTVSRAILALQHSFSGELRLITLTGGANAYIGTILGNGGDQRAASLKVTASVVPAPIIASSADLAKALASEDEVQRVLRSSGDAAYTLIGVGTPTIGSTLMELGYVAPDELHDVVERGGIGDVLGQFFDSEGRVVDTPVHARRIGIDIATLRGRPNVVAAAGGVHKVDAILGAVRGGYIDVLITDESTARDMLQRTDRPTD